MYIILHNFDLQMDRTVIGKVNNFKHSGSIVVIDGDIEMEVEGYKLDGGTGERCQFLRDVTK